MSTPPAPEEQSLELRIQRAKAELERMIDLHPQGMFLTGPEGKVLRANAGLLRLLGLEEFPQVLGRELEGLFPGAGEALRRALAAGAAPGSAASTEAEVELPGRGRRSLRFTAVRSGAGDGLAVVLVDDLTEEKRDAERRARQHKIEAAEALAGTLNHLLNQPLAVIMGRAQLLLFALERGRAETGELRRTLEEIVQLARGIADTLRKAQRFRDFVTASYLEGVDILDLERSTGETGAEDGEDTGSHQA